MRVLVVEDDVGISKGLRLNLRQRGYAVDVCDSVQQAWSFLSFDTFDLVLLDLGLTDGDGVELLQRVRSSTLKQMNANTPMLVLTARESVPDRVECLNNGADDYLIKPFDFDELEARMRALLRRAAGRAQPQITHGDLVIDPASHTLWRKGVAVDLSRREFALLLLLLDANGRILSRPQLEERLYSWDGVVESNAVEVHVHHLRRKLGGDLIRTMRGVGYYISNEET